MTTCYTYYPMFGTAWWGGVALGCAVLLLFMWQRRRILKHGVWAYAAVGALLVISVFAVVFAATKGG